MTIREKGYSHWDGCLSARPRPWWPITRMGIGLMLKKKPFRFFYYGGFIPALAFLIGIYISERIEDFRYLTRGSQKILEVNPAYFKAYFTSDFLLFMLVVLLAVGGAGLISEDLASNSLQLYFSRPLKKRDYLFGKAAVLAFFILTLTLIPGLFFVVFKLLFSGSFNFLSAFPWLPLSIIGYSGLATVFFSLYGLCFSSLSKNRRYVSLLIFALYLLSDLLASIFYDNSKNPVLTLLSLKINLQQVGAGIFKQKPPFPVPWLWSLFVLIVLASAFLFFLRRKVRGVEVVK